MDINGIPVKIQLRMFTDFENEYSRKDLDFHATSSFLVYNVSNKESFDHLTQWMKLFWVKNEEIRPIHVIAFHYDSFDKNSKLLTDEVGVRFCAQVSEKTFLKDLK